MKYIILFIIAILVIVGCKEQHDSYKTINGRWWYFDNNYKEMHASDSLVYVFDFKEIDQNYKLEYVIKNDSFFTNPPRPQFEELNLKPYFRGKIINLQESSFVLVTNNNQILFHKIDGNEDIYVKKLDNIYIDGKKDSIAWEKWLNYCNEYDERAIKFYNDHPELKYKEN